ncbi:MAG: M20/M25/M40 family metallo-hydrolase [Sphingomicrobium sp.]
MRERGWWLTALVAALLAVFALKGLLFAPPALEPAAAGQFNTDRALARLGRVLGDQRAHPVDSAANDAVRGRIIAELRAIGLSPQVRGAMDCNGRATERIVSCAYVRNIVASVGPATGRHVLLNAHYDSTPTGPGAADDGIGVATLLEVAALLHASPPPRPVTLLFNEGEEYGLNGAHAFLRGDPLAKQVDSLINIEARGVSGPAVMFETNSPNGAAMAVYARATRRPFANSISTDMATLIANSTDVETLKLTRWTTLSYAIIGNETRYHSPGDNLAALDRASVGHMGSEVLAATRVMAQAPTTVGQGTRLAFTDIAGLGLMRMPLWLAAAGLGLLLVAAAALARRRRALGRPLAAVSGAVAAGVASAVLAAMAAGLLRHGDYFRAYPLVAYLAVYATMLLGQAAALGWIARGVDRERLRMAGWLLTLLVGGTASLVLPGATIFFLFGPALALIGLSISGRRGLWLVWAGALVQLLMLAELLASIEMLLIDGPLWAVAPLAALAALPFLIEASGWDRGALSPLALAAILLWGGALIMPRASAERPGAFTVDYFRDEPRRTALWSVNTRQAALPRTLAESRHWTTSKSRFGGAPALTSAAPDIAVPRGAIALIGNAVEGRGRRVRFKISRAGGDAFALRIDKAAKVRAIGIPGQRRPIAPDADPGPTILRCSGRACDGQIVELELPDRATVVADFLVTRFSLPGEGAAIAHARPADALPKYSPDKSFSVRRLRF